MWREPPYHLFARIKSGAVYRFDRPRKFWKLHTHSNPYLPVGSHRPVLPQRYYKAAVKAARWLYEHFKGRGVPGWVMNRLSPKIRPIVTDILKYNGITVRS